MTRAWHVFWGLLGLAALKWLGDALSRWLGLSVPGSFWGFLILLMALVAMAEAPKTLSGASHWLLSHLTLFLLPSLVAAAVGLQFASGSLDLLLVAGLLITTVVGAACGYAVSTLNKNRQGSADDA